MHSKRSPAPASASRAPSPRAGAWWRRPLPAPARQGAPGARPRSQTSFRALLGFTLVLILAPQETWKFLAPLHLALVPALVAACAHFNDRYRHKEPLLATGVESPIAFALAAWAALTIPFSLWPSGSVDVLTSTLLKSLFIFLLLGAALDSTSKLRRLVWLLTLASLPLSFTALFHFAQGQFIGLSGGQVVQRIVGYQAGLSSNPNDLALLLNLILPLAAALLFSEKGALKRMLLVLVIALAAAAVVVTFSRTGFLTLATVLLSLAWRIRRGPHRAWLWGAALLVPVVAFFVLPPGYLVHLITITDASSDPTGSAQDRWRDMRLALGMVADHPLFGAGLGMDAVALNGERSSTWTSVHNVYLQYGADLGLPGLALFLALFWSCASGLRAALRRLRGDRDRLELLELTYGLQTSLTGFAVAAFFHPVAYQFPFFYFAGLAVAARGIALEET